MLGAIACVGAFSVALLLVCLLLTHSGRCVKMSAFTELRRRVKKKRAVGSCNQGQLGAVLFYRSLAEAAACHSKACLPYFCSMPRWANTTGRHTHLGSASCLEGVPVSYAF